MANSLASLDQQLPEYVTGYISNPRETFNCELKPWIDPSTNDYDKVKIAKSCLALRNNDGGTLLIGISNEGNILNLPISYDPDVLFTQDIVQACVSEYSAQPFGVDVHHVHLSEPTKSRIVAIVVPGEIITPALCKKNSRCDRNPKVKRGIIYTRTVESNGTVSSAPASQQDLEDVIKRCFDNRTADIGQFLRNHLTSENITVLRQAVNVHNESHVQNHQEELDEFSKNSAVVFSKFFESDGGD